MKFFGFLVCVLLGSAFAGPVQIDEPQCRAPNGGGLQAVLEEFFELLPKEELVSIYLNAVSSDPEVQEVFAYLESEEFHGLLKTIQAQPQFYTLMNYACDKLYLDAYYYINIIGGIIGMPPVTRPPTMVRSNAPGARASSGLHGMLLDMIDVLPLDEIKALFEEKVQSDEYVKLAIELLQSDDFKNILSTVESLEQFQNILTKLRGMGVEVDKVIEALKKFFGWQY